MKTSIILPILALAAGVFAQQPPACLLNAVNGQPDPSNLGAICAQKNATSVQGAIASGCGSNAQVAQSAFIATCSSAGSSVGELVGREIGLWLTLCSNVQSIFDRQILVLLHHLRPWLQVPILRHVRVHYRRLQLGLLLYINNGHICNRCRCSV